jgi:hypothetical protein
VKRKPAREKHDLDRHDGNRAPGNFAEQSQCDADEDARPPGAATRQDRRPRLLHVRSVGRVSSSLQCEIGDDRGAQIELTAMEQRPPAARALAFAKIGREAPLQVGLDGPEIVLQQDEGGRHRGVGFQFEHPVAVVAL